MYFPLYSSSLIVYFCWVMWHFPSIEGEQPHSPLFKFYSGQEITFSTLASVSINPTSTFTFYFEPESHVDPPGLKLTV